MKAIFMFMGTYGNWDIHTGAIMEHLGLRMELMASSGMNTLPAHAMMLSESIQDLIHVHVAPPTTHTQRLILTS